MSNYFGIIVMGLMLLTFLIAGFYIWKAAYKKHVIERREWEEKERLLVQGYNPKNPI